jgi:hypothetical protein
LKLQKITTIVFSCGARRYLAFYAGFFFLCFFQTISLRAQNISGVINTYSEVLSVDTCLNQLVISDATGFSVGDRVLLIQMKGAVIDLSNTAAFGTVTNYENAGNYEFANIASIAGLTITLKNKIVRLYTAPRGFVQLVRVPQYNNVTINGKLTASPWDGRKGGIVVLEASGTISLNADIDVSGMGFIGGQNLTKEIALPNQTDYFSAIATQTNAEKGEGIAKDSIGFEAGRGPLANGGGGGNDQNAGGGGGSNGGLGGLGGDQGTTATYSQLAIGGLGGRRIDYQTFSNRIFFGGGGGAGQENDTHGSDGGDGGGIVIIRGNILAANGKISADGSSALEALEDGAGGGGGGGTIVLDVNTIQNNPALSAQGGNGGNNNAPDNVVQHWCYAPGGGGSGGLVVVKGPSVPPSNLNGGKAGTVINNALPCFNTTFGAADGEKGGGIWNNIITDGNVLFTYPKIAKSRDTICQGDFAQLGLPGAHGFKWTPNIGLDNDAIANPKASPANTTRYTVNYLDDRNCDFQDTVLVIVNPKPKPKIAGSDSVCSGQTFFYKIDPFPGATYQWTANGGSILTGQGSEDIGILWGSGTTGTINVDVIAPGSLCEGIDVMNVVISPAISATISGADTICSGDTVILTATAGFAKYIWSNGDSLQSIKVATSGDYFVQTISGGGCITYSDTVSVLVHKPSMISIIPSAPMMGDVGGVDTLILSDSVKSISWSTGSTKDTLFITDSGTYSVSIIDSNGCPATASIYIPRDISAPEITLSLDTLEAAPCDEIIFPLRIDTSKNMPPSGATDYVTEITFDQSLLSPADKTNYVIHGRWGTITLYGTRPDFQINGVLPGLQFTVALGDTIATILKIETFAFKNGKKVRITTYNGLFKLTKLCTEGGVRLFAETDSLILKQNIPNPAHDRTTITYSLIEEGNSRLWISDIVGRKVATLLDAYAKPGLYSIDFNTSVLSGGNYFYFLQTPTSLKRRMMRIEK